MADKTILVEIEYDTDTAVKNINKLSDQIVENEKQAKALKDAYKEGTITQEQYSQALAENNEELKKGKSERANFIKQIQSEKGSTDQLTAANKSLIAERNKLSGATKESRKRISEINKTIDKNNKLINKNKSETEKQRASWGQMSPALGKAQNGLRGIGQAFKALLANPIVAIIAGIVGSFIALSKALRRSEEGQNAFNKASAVLRSIFETLLDVLTKVAEKIVKAFKDPQQAVKDLWEIIKTNLVNRVKGLADLFVGLGDVITNSMKLAGNAIANIFRKTNKDLDIFKENLKSASADIGKALLQTATGFDADKVIDGFKRLGDEIRADADATKRLADAQAALDKLVRKNVVDEAKLRKEISQLRLKVAEKDKYSDEERLSLIDQAIEKEQQLLDQNLMIAKERLRIRKIQNSLHASNKEDLDEEARLEAEVFRAEQTSFEGRRRLASERAAIAQRLNKQDEKNTDDEVERRKIALQKLDELNKKSLLSHISDLEEKRDKEIEFENEEFQRKIENEMLLAEEIELIKAEHAIRLSEIDEEYKQAKIAKEQEALQVTLDSIDAIGEAAGALADERTALQADLLNKAVAFNKLEGASEKDKFAAFAGFSNSFTSLVKKNYDKEFASLEQQKAAALELAGDNEAAKEQIEREYAKKAEILKKKQFDSDKRKAIIDTLINTAVAVVKALPNIPLSVVVGGLGLAQSGIIASKKYTPTQMAKGGKMTLFGGKDHAHGGTHLYGSDGTHLEVEKGEAAYVLNKNATAEISALSAINESHGGKSFAHKSSFLQDGGQAQSATSLDQTALINAFKNVTIITKVSDIKTGLSKFEGVINNSIV